MKIAEKLKNTDKTLFSFEIVPPLKGGSIEKLYNKLDLLAEFNPLNINITFHQDEVVYSEDSFGNITKRVERKHPGTVALAAAIKKRYPEVETVPHLICGGMSKMKIFWHFEAMLLKVADILLLKKMVIIIQIALLDK